MDIIGAISNKSVKIKEERQDVINGLGIVEQDDTCVESDKIATRLVEGGEETQIQYEMIDEDELTGFRVVQLADVDEVAQPAQGPPSPLQTFYSDPLNGRIYMIGPSHDVFLGTQKAVVARSLVEENTRPPVTRDDKRRATHNEVERRRRDKINHWIMKLGKIIPECKQDSAKIESQSKGGILAKACDYITELRETNERLLVYAKENEQLLADIENLGQQNEQLREENARLKALLRQAGIPNSLEELQ